MHHPLTMGFGHAQSDLAGVGNGGFGSQGTALQEVLQRLAVDILHDDHGGELAGINGVDDADVGMIQTGRGPRLGQDGGCRTRLSGAQHFQGHATFQRSVPSAKDGAKRAGAENRFDAIRAQQTIGA